MPKVTTAHVESASNVVAQAKRQLHAAILGARAGGATLQEIADAAGLTKGRISQIVNEPRVVVDRYPEHPMPGPDGQA
jgi:hypothetical protein